jgi:DNA-binding NtrC family response regulator
MTRLYRHLQASGSATEQEPTIMGDSAAIQAVFHAIRKISSVDAPVLITGESGTGKELAARAIHRRSSRAKGPFIPVNCGALPASLIQAELFGHEKGAFTGAQCRRIGRFEAADGGTLFLDEIEDLPLDLQVNLLRFLEEGTVERLGKSRPVQVDVRVIAASHQDLEQAVAQGQFRDDLLFRLNVLRLFMPPLAKRGGDIKLLARAFLHRFTLGQAMHAKHFSTDALAAMQQYPWPGNVRELMNRVQRAAVMSDARSITANDLGLADTEYEPLTLAQARLYAEKEAIETALARAGGNATQAARDLGISRATLYRLLDKYGIGSSAP